MQAAGWPITLLMGHFFGSALPTTSPMVPSSHSPSFTTEPNEEGKCPLTISPSALVVRFGDPLTANCSISVMGFSLLGWVVPMAVPQATMNRFQVWTVDWVDQWNITPTCYALSELGGKCDIELPVIVYKPPLKVSISFGDYVGRMIDGDHHTLQCTVHDVAPIEKLIVNFYREQVILETFQVSNSTKSPVTAVFTLDFQPSKEDDKAQFWCEAKLELGPNGPQPPLVTVSEKLTATVLYGPLLQCPRKLQVKEGEGLKCDVMGNPHPLVTWIRNGQVVALPAHSQTEHAGKYIAWAKGLLEKNFTVEVEVLVNTGTRNIHKGHLTITLLLIHILTQR